MADLASIAKAYGVRAVDDAPFAPLPLVDQTLDEDEAALRARLRQLSYEVPAASWRSMQCEGTPTVTPNRFIDGSVFSRTVAIFRVGRTQRPAVLASVGALAMELNGRALSRQPQSVRIETILCLNSEGMERDDITALEQGLRDVGIRLITTQVEPTADFEVLRRRTWDAAKEEMEKAEREVLLSEPATPTVVDGLLERRLETMVSQEMPAYGFVKRQARRYLPLSHLDVLHELRPGERTPAFLLETEHAVLVTWYLRLSSRPELSPGQGVVRVTVPREFIERRFPNHEERWREISAVSAWLRHIRHREASYSRVDVSLEPIVRVEDELHALLPSISQQAARFRRALGV